jgi:hypothetical protein
LFSVSAAGNFRWAKEGRKAERGGAAIGCVLPTQRGKSKQRN